jgi:hypothetical protein
MSRNNLKLSCILLFLLSPILTYAAATDAVSVAGDLKVDGIHFSADGSVLTRLSDSIGPPGPANNLSIGTVTTGASGSQASATITGTPPDQVLNMTIPQGPVSATANSAVKAVANATTELTTTAIATAGSITVNVPGSGNVIVFVSGFFSILNAGGQSSINFKISETASDMSFGNGNSAFQDNVSVDESITEQINVIRVFQVSTAGSKTFYLNVQGSGKHIYVNPVMTALYVPGSL